MDIDLPKECQKCSYLNKVYLKIYCKNLYHGTLFKNCLLRQMYEQTALN